MKINKNVWNESFELAAMCYSEKVTFSGGRPKTTFWGKKINLEFYPFSVSWKIWVKNENNLRTKYVKQKLLQMSYCSIFIYLFLKMRELGPNNGVFIYQSVDKPK